MSERWVILCVLFVARMTMGFQFQSVAALAPLIGQTHAATLAEIGLLIGLYMAPGILVAIPGGALAARFGDKRVVALSLAIMVLGGLIVALSPGWELILVGRVLAGVGGVLVNVVMTKLVVDWFAGREMATAMAIYVNSWPVGIALALAVLPPVAAWGGLGAAWLAVVAVVVAGLVLFVLVYRAPPNVAPVRSSLDFGALPFGGLFLAGMIWGLYNAALAMVFSFGPTLLTGRGLALAAAGSAISLFMLVLSVGLPLGGIVSDRTGRRDMVIAVSLVGFAVLAPAIVVVSTQVALPVLVLMGLVFSLGAGPIMTLPALVLTPSTRTLGMGVFYTLYYIVMMAAPPLAGAVAEASGTVGATLVVGAAFCGAALAALGLFRLGRARAGAR